MALEQDSIVHVSESMLGDTGHSMLDVQLPQYYREGFFSRDTLFHPELRGGRYGTAGDPVPYTIHGDNILTGLLLLCFMLAVIAFSNVSSFFTRQAKAFFYLPHGGTTEVTETATELRFQLFLVLLTSLMLSLLFYFYTIYFVGDTFILESQYLLIVIYLGMVVGYLLVKCLLYTIVNLVFFDGKRNEQWIKSILFIISIEGVLLFPAVILQAYFDISVKNVVFYFTTVLIIVKFLTFHKSYIIFFRQNVFRLQIILYFCALEMIPLLALWSVLVITANSLKVNF